MFFSPPEKTSGPAVLWMFIYFWCWVFLIIKPQVLAVLASWFYLWSMTPFPQEMALPFLLPQEKTPIRVPLSACFLLGMDWSKKKKSTYLGHVQSDLIQFLNVSCCISNKKSILLNPHLFDVSIPFVGL
jgi:hypothetical protein